MQRKTVLFIPSSYYLSDDAFIKLAASSDWKCIYLDPKDSNFRATNLRHKENFEKAFDEILQLPEDMYGGTNNILRFISVQIKKIQILLMILKIKPHLIIVNSDGTFTARVIGRFFPRIPFIIVQTALITVVAEKYIDSRKSLFKKMISKYLGWFFFPYLSIVRPFGLNHPHANVLLWGDSTKELLLPYVNKQKLRVVGNILFEMPDAKGLPKNKILLLAPHTATDAEALDFCKDVLDIVNHFPEIHFRVRIHPIMRVSLFQDFFNKAKVVNVEIILNSESITQSILNSNAVVSQYSAATIDVIALGRHVVLFKKINEERLSHWFEKMELCKTNTTRGVVGAIENLRSNGFLEAKPPNDISVDRHWHAIGEQSRKNIILEINRIMKESIN